MNQIFFLAFQIFNLLLLASWLTLLISALIALQRRSLTPLAYFIWAAIIITVPWLGAAAFWILQPGNKPHESPAG